MPSPTQIALKLLRKEHWLAESVEKWVKTDDGGFRRDLFKIADIFCVSTTEPAVMLIQVSSQAGISARRKKISASEELRICLRAGILFELWGSKKVEGRWELIREPITLASLSGVQVELKGKRRSRKKPKERSLFDQG